MGCSCSKDSTTAAGDQQQQQRVPGRLVLAALEAGAFDLPPPPHLENPMLSPIASPTLGGEPEHGSFRRSRRSPQNTFRRSPRRYQRSPTTNSFPVDMPIARGEDSTVTELGEGGVRLSPRLSVSSLQQLSTTTAVREEDAAPCVNDWVDALDDGSNADLASSFNRYANPSSTNNEYVSITEVTRVESLRSTVDA